MSLRRWLPARKNDKRKATVRSVRIEALEQRMVLSSTGGEALTEFSNSLVLVKFRDTAAIEPVKGTSLGEAVGLVPGLYTVNVQADVDVTEVVAAYQSQTNVEYAQLDYKIQIAATPNDTSYSSLYAMAKIAAPQAWDTTTGSRSIIVGVIDTGVDYNHPDLAANIWRNTREIEGNGIDDDGNGYRDDVRGYDFANNDANPMDDNGHGTHVAGTIGAVGNNGRGVTGVAWNVQIMPLKFLSANGSGSLSNAVLAVDYAVRNGAKILNNSYGGGGFFAAMNDAVGRARAAGVIFVAAAGNEANNNDLRPAYPAGYNFDNVVSVAATDSGDRLASFSNYGATSVDIAAPGVGILSTTLNNTYSSFSGTSMASPHVAGAAALVWAANPSLTYAQVIQRLYVSADPVAGLAGKVATGGRLNVGRAVAGTPTVDRTAPRVESALWTGTAGSNVTGVTLTFSEAVQASTVTTANLRVVGPTGQAIAVSSITAVAGSNGRSFNVMLPTQTVAGNYTLTVLPTVKDTAGNLLNQDGDAIFGETTQDQFTSTTTLVRQTVSTFTWNGAVSIRDNATTTITLNVTQDIRISDLDVRLNLTHTYNSDLVITLTGPAGQTVTLFNRRGGSGDNLTNTVFDDEATRTIASGAAPFSGSFRPETSLTAFDGRSTKGVWTLSIRDAAARDVGRITSFSLVATGTAVAGATRVKGIADDTSSAPVANGPVLNLVTPQTVVATGSNGPVISGLIAATSNGSVGRTVIAAVTGQTEETSTVTTNRLPASTTASTPVDDLDSLFADFGNLFAAV
jgi:serine protease